MKYKEYFRQRINVYGPPKLTKEQNINLITLFDLESKIDLLDHLPSGIQKQLTREKQLLVKELHKLTRRLEPNILFKNINFKI